MSKILLAEDGLITAFHLKALFKKNGHEVIVHVTRGEEVFEQFKNSNPDILMLDIMLEGQMNGLEVAQQIRTVSDVPIIFMSALTDEATLNVIKNIPRSIKHDKPFEEDLLIQEVDKMLSAK